MRQIQRFGKYTLQFAPPCLKKGDEVIALTQRQLETLLVIVKAQGKPVCKEFFFTKVWQGAFVEEGNLTQTIFLLRRALGKLPDGGEYIETLPRYGYRLSPAALQFDPPDTPEMPKVPPPAPEVLPPTPSVAVIQEVIVPAKSESSADVAIITPIERKPMGSVTLTGRNLSAIAAVLVCVGIGGTTVLGWAHHQPVVLRSKQLTRDGISKPMRAPLLLAAGRLYFTETIDNRTYLAEVSTKGGEVTRHASPTAGGWAVSFSPQHRDFLFASGWEGINDPPLIGMSEMGGIARPLGSLRGHSAAWSPDGTHLAFVRGRELLVADSSGDNVRILAQMADVPYWPNWSPDGTFIRFTRYEGGPRQSLWEISAAGGTLRPVFAGSPHEHQVCCGSWSSDGRHFVYVVDQAYSSAIWVRTEPSRFNPFQSGSEWELATGPVDFWRSPVISSDGTVVYAVGEQARGELVRIAPASPLKYVPYMPDFSADSITYSHDGKWMAYTLYPEGTLWRSRSDGSEKLQLSRPGTFTRFPQWAPDDQSVLFLSTSDNDPWTVRQVDAKGGAVKTLLADGLDQGTATFSPDGKHIAFGRSLEFGVRGASPVAITLLDLVSGRAETLPGSEGLWIARWSPNGDFLAAATMDRQKLLLYSFKDKTWSELASQTVNDILWSKNGDYLYFDTQMGGDAALFRVNMTSRQVERFADLDGLHRTGSFGWHLSLTPQDQVVMLKQTGLDEVYSLDVKFQ